MWLCQGAILDGVIKKVSLDLLQKEPTTWTCGGRTLQAEERAKALMGWTSLKMFQEKKEEQCGWSVGREEEDEARGHRYKKGVMA